MALIRCGTCELEYDRLLQSSKCPHRSLGATPETRPVMSRRQRPSQPFAAQFNGLCNGCFYDVEAGEEIVMWKGKAYHNDEDCCDGLREDEDQPTTDTLRDRWADE